MAHNVKIVQSGLNVKLYIDGKELEGVTAVDFSFDEDTPPILGIQLTPESVEIIAQENGIFAPEVIMYAFEEIDEDDDEKE